MAVPCMGGSPAAGCRPAAVAARPPVAAHLLACPPSAALSRPAAAPPPPAWCHHAERLLASAPRRWRRPPHGALRLQDAPPMEHLALQPSAQLAASRLAPPATWLVGVDPCCSGATAEAHLSRRCGWCLLPAEWPSPPAGRCLPSAARLLRGMRRAAARLPHGGRHRRPACAADAACPALVAVEV